MFEVLVVCGIVLLGLYGYVIGVALEQVGRSIKEVSKILRDITFELKRINSRLDKL